MEPQKSEELLRILKELEKNTSRISNPEREKFLQQAAEWENHNDIATIRQAGISKEQNEKDPLQKHALLSSAYMEKKGDGKYKIDFRGNNLAEYKVGAGDIFPPNIGTISVNGTIAVRTINPKTGRIGYYNKHDLEHYKTYDYVPIFSGDIVEVIKAKPYEDTVVQRRQLQENIALYQERGGTAVEVQEMDKKDVKNATKNRLKNLREEVEPMETNEAMRKLVETARTYLDYNKGKMFHEKFYSKEAKYKGGRLGCAITTTWIAREAGLINFTDPSVMNTKGKFNERGWGSQKYIPGKERPGQIITWKRKSGGNHIGIIVGPNQVIHNVFDQKTQRARPKLTAIKGYGPETRTITLWTPPGKESQKHTTYENPEIPVEPGQPHHTMTKNLDQIRRGQELNAETIKILPQQKKLLRYCVEQYSQHRLKYEQVSRATGIPPELIFAIHFRESGIRFDRYLHNGDPLGKPTTHVPKGIYFPKGAWTEAAIHALNSMKLQQRLGLSSNTRDMGKILTYAELYNGLGYRRRANTPSPYVYAGTNMYKGGLYVADGKFNPNAYDKRVGIAAIVMALNNPSLVS